MQNQKGVPPEANFNMAADGRAESREMAQTVAGLVAELELNGIAVLPGLVSEDQLRRMQEAFAIRLRRMRWNDLEGYEKELHRHVIQDVLTLEQGFVHIGLHALVTGPIREYVGEDFALVEAKGWKSLPTKRDFHGWHGDAWYHQERPDIPREIKLAFYLTDVRTGAFNYVKGSHRKQHPRMVRSSELKDVPASGIAELTGPAGTAFLFDTSGIHRQGVPILEPRQAVFYNYHDPRIRLRQESVDYYRYHPLVLNSAFLGHLSNEEHRILGFGNQTRYRRAFERFSRHGSLENLFSQAFSVALRVDDLRERGRARLNRLWRRG